MLLIVYIALLAVLLFWPISDRQSTAVGLARASADITRRHAVAGDILTLIDEATGVTVGAGMINSGS
jgi:hypothetical protein